MPYNDLFQDLLSQCVRLKTFIGHYNTQIYGMKFTSDMTPNQHIITLILQLDFENTNTNIWTMIYLSLLSQLLSFKTFFWQWDGVRFEKCGKIYQSDQERIHIIVWYNVVWNNVLYNVVSIQHSHSFCTKMFCTTTIYILFSP